ncbi:MAG TPA: NADH-quinone oxidoreductase subunit C [Armatimonadetes bacterium]|nr:NADH-quinone oxidoreductase subunit C [Armatimonadota bacterium]
MSLSPEELEVRLRERLPTAILGTRIGKNGLEIRVDSEQLVQLCRVLRDDPELRFDFLRCISALDWIDEDEIEVVYHLYSIPRGHYIVLKVRVPRSEPRVPSVTHVWATANWHEREAFDLVGVIFDGHPDLRRILLPPEWEGHPLRKDYAYDPVEFDEDYAGRIQRGEIE